MPDKITSRSLAYNSSLPPFLAALHAQVGRSASGPDSMLATRRRIGQKRSASEEAEDGPLIVDERGNVVELDEKLEEKDRETNETGRPGDISPGRETIDESSVTEGKEKVAGIGAGKKRRTGKVVGGGTEDDRVSGKGEGLERLRQAIEDTKSKYDMGKGGGSEGKSGVQSKEQQTKSGKPPSSGQGGKPKKAKKMKLSFDEDG